MRRIPLFWKIWVIITMLSFVIISASNMLVTLGIPMINQIQVNNDTEKVINEIETDVKKNGVNKEHLKQYSDNGYIIEVKLNSEVVYWTEGVVQKELYYIYNTSENGHEVTYATPIRYYEYSILDIDYYNFLGKTENSPIPMKDGMDDYTVLQRGFSVDGDSYGIKVANVKSYSPLSYIQNIQSYFLENLFYFIIISLILSSLLSLIISLLISRKVKKINKFVSNMETMQEPERTNYKQGDELVQLENDIYRMYGKLRQSIRDLDDEVIYTKKLEEDKQLFMRGATHELKTPIMAMNSMIEGMLNHVGDYQNHEVYLRKCYDNLQKIQKLVDEILSVSKTEHLHYNEDIVVMPIIEEAQQLYREVDEQAIINIVNESSKELRLTMPADSFSKIISNLLSNAVYYRKPTTPVTITVTDNKISVCNIIPDDAVIDVNTIFKPFVSEAGEMADGHGLGLYIVQLLLERYGYSFDCLVDSEKHVFCFEIYL
ncbi:sensor histidine kinase [Culicoidibacter larvae]|uniref:histidine kinase n=1 Tax=Culicoidibacter larvae TaxID=2579976 RepID=A0A5R8QAV3_9FIRM|nr:HAMP domain-containing sensor histidine kinase [Culicoidibacter larvae]TLG72755.1 HAMP domain-containing histidine kinase [Culicoidibacter larvae]